MAAGPLLLLLPAVLFRFMLCPLPCSLPFPACFLPVSFTTALPDPSIGCSLCAVLFVSGFAVASTCFNQDPSPLLFASSNSFRGISCCLASLALLLPWREFNIHRRRSPHWVCQHLLHHLLHCSFCERRPLERQAQQQRAVTAGVTQPLRQLPCAQLCQRLVSPPCTSFRQKRGGEAGATAGRVSLSGKQATQVWEPTAGPATPSACFLRLCTRQQTSPSSVSTRYVLPPPSTASFSAPRMEPRLPSCEATTSSRSE